MGVNLVGQVEERERLADVVSTPFPITRLDQFYSSNWRGKMERNGNTRLGVHSKSIRFFSSIDNHEANWNGWNDRKSWNGDNVLVLVRSRHLSNCLS